MQPFRLNENAWKKARVVKPLGTTSYTVESSGEFYVRNRGHLKRSAEDGNPLAAEEPWSLTTDALPTRRQLLTSPSKQLSLHLIKISPLRHAMVHEWLQALRSVRMSPLNNKVRLIVAEEDQPLKPVEISPHMASVGG